MANSHLWCKSRFFKEENSAVINWQSLRNSSFLLIQLLVPWSHFFSVHGTEFWHLAIVAKCQTVNTNLNIERTHARSFTLKVFLRFSWPRHQGCLRLCYEVCSDATDFWTSLPAQLAISPFLLSSFSPYFDCRLIIPLNSTYCFGTQIPVLLFELTRGRRIEFWNLCHKDDNHKGSNLNLASGCESNPGHWGIFTDSRRTRVDNVYRQK